MKDLGEAKKILVMNIILDRKRHKRFVRQKKYIELKKFRMDTSRSFSLHGMLISNCVQNNVQIINKI